MKALWLKKFNWILLAMSGYILCLGTMPIFFDTDFGWHLRFGRDFFKGVFPYLDTATWPHYGQMWVNHEWGGDAILWFLYSRFGYYSIPIVMSAVLWASFLIALKAFRVPLKSSALLAALLCALSVQHIVFPRLSMFTPFFLALILYTLERVEQGRLYWWWPLLFWVWSSLHGSWILGFIVIGVYFVATAAQYLVARYASWWVGDKWSPATLRELALPAGLSLAVILINPYGYHLYTEILVYFQNPFFKKYIVEWFPSYKYPLFWKPLTIMAVSSTLVVVAFLKRRISWHHVFLFGALLASGLQYLRNALPFMLVAAPVLAVTINEVMEKVINLPIFKKSFFVNRPLVIWAVGSVFLVMAMFSLSQRVRYIPNIWSANSVLATANMPVAGTNFLRNYAARGTIYVFSNFNWGGYLNWQLPEARLYLDGRGPATWRVASGETTLEHYLKILVKPGGLKELEQGPAEYIFLVNPVAHGFLDPPDIINRWFLSAVEQEIVTRSEQTTLEKDIATSTNWKNIYSDEQANIWQRMQ